MQLVSSGHCCGFEAKASVGDCKQALTLWEETQMKQESRRVQDMDAKEKQDKRAAFVHTFPACNDKQF